MNIDLLGDDSSDSEGRRNILHPTIRPQKSNTISKAAAQLAQLNITSCADTPDTAAIATGNDKDNNCDLDEDDDFGEFLQSEAVSDGWESPEKQQVTTPTCSDIVSEHTNGDELLPYSLPQPPPPASSSQPNLDGKVNAGGNVRSRRGTISDGHTQSSEYQESENAIADQLLSWISGTEGSVPSDHITVEHAGLMVDIAHAWEDAEGLMGGSNPSTHIAEIATRLCTTIPPNPQYEQTRKPLSPTTILQADPIEGPISVLLSRKCAESSYRLLPETSIALQSYNLVWPLYSNTRSADEDTDLTSAYLHIAKMLEPSTDNTSTTTAKTQ
ncbi:hypothetical protein H4R24_002635 [Coemansia sp. RSA 988]|nr:hypothetical protein H4R24_002635 [Coemansia sp. RSA 988]